MVSDHSQNDHTKWSCDEQMAKNEKFLAVDWPSNSSLHLPQIHNDASSSKPEGQTTSSTNVNGTLVGEKDGKEEEIVPTPNGPNGSTAC